MYNIVNIPHKDDHQRELRVFVEDFYIHIRSVIPNYDIYKAPTSAFASQVGVCDMYIGEHMLYPEKRNALFEMIGRGFVNCIEAGRKAGYAHAQSDIRAALGITKS